MSNFLNFQENLNLYLWFFCLFLIFFASFWVWGKYNWLFGFLIFYIIIYPMYKKWDKFISGIQYPWPEFWISLFVLCLLTTFWLFLFIKLLPKILNFLINKGALKDTILENKIINVILNPVINKDSKIKQGLKNFSILWLSWVELFSKLPFSSVMFDFLSNNFKKYLNTKAKILWFFCFTLILPRMLTLFALFYDIYIEKQLYWFPRMGVVLSIAIVTKMSLTLVDEVSKKNFEFLSSLLSFNVVEQNIISEKIKKKLKEISPNSNIIINVQVKEELKDQIYGEGFNKLLYEYYKNNATTQWCENTKELLDSVFNSFLFLFLSLNVSLQIIILVENHIT